MNVLQDIQVCHEDVIGGKKHVEFVDSVGGVFGVVEFIGTNTFTAFCSTMGVITEYQRYEIGNE